MANAKTLSYVYSREKPDDAHMAKVLNGSELAMARDEWPRWATN
jgi:hypothetical protein